LYLKVTLFSSTTSSRWLKIATVTGATPLWSGKWTSRVHDPIDVAQGLDVSSESSLVGEWRKVRVWILLRIIAGRQRIEACSEVPGYKRYQINGWRHSGDTEKTYGGVA
jgi:hypothetical protein